MSLILKFIISINFLFICHGQSFNKYNYIPQFSLDKYNASPSIINGTSFPRRGEYLWRAMGTGQYDIPKAIMAMFGDDNQNIESKLFTYMKLRLTNKKSPFLFLNIPEDIKKSLESYLLKKHHYTEKEASLICEEILDKFYLNKKDKENIDNFINYNSDHYINWNRGAVFSAITPLTSYKYKKPIMVSIKEDIKRSVDINYWNFVNNSFWSKNKFDIGEFITPGHIEASSVQAVFKIKKSTIKIAFMKTSYENETYILGFISPKTNCLIRDEIDKKIYGCKFLKRKRHRASYTNSPMRPNSDLKKPNFILKLCNIKSTCSIKESLLSYFEIKSDKRLSSSLTKVIQNINIDNNQVKIFYRDYH